jgi:hypothetical protein
MLGVSSGDPFCLEGNVRDAKGAVADGYCSFCVIKGYKNFILVEDRRR